jgi:hypothetical protein
MQLRPCCLRLVFHQLSNCPPFGQKKEEIGEKILFTLKKCRWLGAVGSQP